MKCSYEEAKKVMKNMTFQAFDYVPSMEELEKEILPNMKKYFSFLLWIMLTGHETEENKSTRDFIQKQLMLEYAEQVNGLDGQKQEKEKNSEGEEV